MSTEQNDREVVVPSGEATEALDGAQRPIGEGQHAEEPAPEPLSSEEQRKNKYFEDTVAAVRKVETIAEDVSDLYDLSLADGTIEIGLKSRLLSPDRALPQLERLYQVRVPKAYAGLKALIRQYAHDLSLPAITLDDLIEQADHFGLPQVMVDELIKKSDMEPFF